MIIDTTLLFTNLNIPVPALNVKSVMLPVNIQFFIIHVGDRVVDFFDRQTYTADSYADLSRAFQPQNFQQSSRFTFPGRLLFQVRAVRRWKRLAKQSTKNPRVSHSNLHQWWF